MGPVTGRECVCSRANQGCVQAGRHGREAINVPPERLPLAIRALRTWTATHLPWTRSASHLRTRAWGSTCWSQDRVGSGTRDPATFGLEAQRPPRTARHRGPCVGEVWMAEVTRLAAHIPLGSRPAGWGFLKVLALELLPLSCRRCLGQLPSQEPPCLHLTPRTC
ncbi:hypothetical protein NDU88_005695 [Pleurodeles waltl]|uniref:Uncharacterized protein n=1 Tax=Pleurodeles waltl TaxID=8319 RepID=A0AAV7WB96_PLEWA|nr:hypothetical protein NDU88_005695 [Pleurodeles waltl]